MKYKATEEQETENIVSELKLHTNRIRKILDDAIYKLKILKFLPGLLTDNGEILRLYLNNTEADFIMMVCKDPHLSKNELEDRPDLLLISNMIERINMFNKSRENDASSKQVKGFLSGDIYEFHVAYAVEILFKCKPLIKYIETLEDDVKCDNLINNFIEAIEKLKVVTDARLNVTANEEVKRENDLRTAYRASLMLSNNIQELEEQLDKQRQELGKENDRKQALLEDLTDKIEVLKEKTKEDIHKIVYDSEIMMMKDYNKSVEVQAELAEEAKETTKQYETLLEEHLEQEKALRMKRLKVETQLASWIAKYDQDMGDKQAELEALEETFKAEKEEYDKLMDQFEEQEKEYTVLMQEKEEEEQRIMEEKAWLFLQNRSARRIQRCWKAYRARKLARKKGRKGKKKGSADRKSPKGKKKEEMTTLKGGPDPNAIIESKFNSELLADIQQKDAFEKKDVVMDL